MVVTDTLSDAMSESVPSSSIGSTMQMGVAVDKHVCDGYAPLNFFCYKES